MPKQLPVFWGCTIGNRLPFLEKTTRRVLEALGFEAISPDRLTCCPDPVYGRGLDESDWLALAARNLAVCEAIGDDLLVPCNGCLATFHKATNALVDQKIRRAVNRRLENSGLNFETPPRVQHILSFLASIGTDRLKAKFVHRLEGLTLCVHYGCHIANEPSTALGDGDSNGIFEKLLSTTGLKVVPYQEKSLCCGASIMPFDAEGSLGLLRQKFRGAIEAGANALVLCCPLCFVQLDMEARKLEKDETLPVFYITEILALALGIPEKELHFDWHANKPGGLLRAKLEKRLRSEALEAAVRPNMIEGCCGACSYECSAVKGFPDNDELRFDPVAIVEKVKAGEIEEVLRSPEIWRCLKCHECARFCPRGDGLPLFFEALQDLARRSGLPAEPIEQKLNLIRSSGLGIPKNAAIRKEFDLPAIEPIEKEELAGFFDESE